MKRVIAFGAFDPLHEGHIDFFRQAKALGDYLLVVVAADETIRETKGREPFQGEEQRRQAVAAAGADEAKTGNTQEDKYRLLGELDFDVVAIGYDQEPDDERVREELKKHGKPGVPVVRLKAYEPDKYKSSLLRSPAAGEALIAGIDAGATWIKAGLFSSDLKLQRQVRCLSGAAQSVPDYRRSIEEAWAGLKVKEAGGAVLLGLALPALFAPDRKTIKFMANVRGPAEEVRNLVEEIRASLGLKEAAADNDAACAALAEWRFGHGEGRRETRLLHLTWGTGIGTGLVADGASVYGWEGGHLPLMWGGRGGANCQCGSNIDLESFASVPALVRRARELWREKRLDTGLSVSDFADERQTPKVLVARAEAGDELADAVITEGLTWLSRGILSLSVIAQPDIVTVGGAMMENDWLLMRLREAVQQEAAGFTRVSLQSAAIVRAKLKNEAGMIGAALNASRAIV